MSVSFQPCLFQYLMIWYSKTNHKTSPQKPIGRSQKKSFGDFSNALISSTSLHKTFFPNHHNVDESVAWLGCLRVSRPLNECHAKLKFSLKTKIHFKIRKQVLKHGIFSNWWTEIFKAFHSKEKMAKKRSKINKLDIT